MIILNLKGGLGNQLFQLMAISKFAILNSEKTIYIYTGNLGNFDVKRNFSLDPFIEELGIEVIILNRKKWYFNKYILGVCSKLKIISITEDNYNRLNFFSKILNLFILDDYFQSLEYFDLNILNKMQNGLLKNYSLDKVFRDKNEVFDFSEFRAHNIGVHIRGTDRLKEIKTDYLPEYVDSFLSYAKEKIYCFTDDIEYSRKCMTHSDKDILYMSDFQLSDLEEFYLISLFQNFVITNSNSSFSIFARLLAKNTSKTFVIKEYGNDLEDYLYEILGKCQNVEKVSKLDVNYQFNLK